MVYDAPPRSRLKAGLKGFFVVFMFFLIGSVIGSLIWANLSDASGEALGDAFRNGFFVGGLIGVLLARPASRFEPDAGVRAEIKASLLVFMCMLLGGATGEYVLGSRNSPFGIGVGAAIGIALASRQRAREEGRRPRSGEPSMSPGET